MTDPLYEKIIKRMKSRGTISPKAFNKELSFIRFDKSDSRKIIRDMERRGMLRLKPKKNNKVLIIINKRLR